MSGIDVDEDPDVPIVVNVVMGQRRAIVRVDADVVARTVFALNEVPAPDWERRMPEAVWLANGSGPQIVGTLHSLPLTVVVDTTPTAPFTTSIPFDAICAVGLFLTVLLVIFKDDPTPRTAIPFF